ncbi:MAG: DUF294 nucleotidyltransferase-like domain-containing protein, partial [Betaproteobacteria bacterium]
MSVQAPRSAIADAVVEFLRGHPPFDHVEEATLIALAAACRVAYFARGEIIVSPVSGIPTAFYIVHKGRVVVEQSDANKAAGTADLAVGPGECFPLSALIGKRATTSTYRAAGDVFCYAVPAERLYELLHSSPALLEFSTRHLATLLARAQIQVHNRAGQAARDLQSMSSSLGDLLRRSPVSCAEQASTGEVLDRMRDEKVGSMVITDTAGLPVGIFTERDVVVRVAAARLDVRAPITQVMTPSPLALPATASAGDAALLMARHGIRHVVVLDGEKFRGIVSERDLFALQRLSLRRLSADIAAAASVKDVQSAAARIGLLARNLLAQGIGAESLTQFIAELNDRVTCRVIELALTRHALGDVPFCWIALGSEGRFEQTFSTDQDNGIIFDVPAGHSAAALRQRLLPFAQDVNQGLAECGFPLCKGNIMAGNPDWCLSLDEWQATFSGWMRNSAPAALLNAAIFFDFRPLWGVAALADRLREWLLTTASVNRRFLHQMAVNALQTQPPLGLVQDFATSGSGRDANTVDLKAQGARLFVDVARIYALQYLIPATGTAARLRAFIAVVGVNRDEIAAVLDAFFFIQILRLRHDMFDAGDAT